MDLNQTNGNMWVPADVNGQPLPPEQVPLNAEGKPIPPRWVQVDAYGHVIPQQEEQSGKRFTEARSMGKTGRAKRTMEAEGTIGKVLMAVLASVFILISICIFALVVFPDLSELAQLIAIAVFSILLFAVGMVATAKKPESHGAYILLNCGMAMVYTSDMIYYSMFRQVWFFPILLVWGVFCAFLARGKKHRTSLIFVSQCANAIAACYVIGCNTYHLNLDALLASLALVLTVGCGFIVNHIEEYHRNWVNLVPAAVSTFIISVMLEDAKGYGYGMFLILAIGIIAAVVSGFTCYWIRSKHTVLFGICNCFFALAFALLCTDVLPGGALVLDLTVFVCYLLMVIASELRIPGKYAPGKMIFLLYAVIFTAVPFMDDEPFATYSVVGLLAIMTLLAGFLMDNRFYKITSLVLAVLFLFNGGNHFAHLGIGIAFVLVAMILVLTQIEQYRSYYKILIEVFAYILPLTDVADIIGIYDVSWSVRSFWESFAMIVIAILFQIVPSWNLKRFSRQVETPVYITNLVLGGIAMIDAISVLADCQAEGVLLFENLTLVLCVFLWCSTSLVLMRRRRGGWTAFVIGILWAILLGSVMEIYQAPGNAISIVGIAYALLCIVIGFHASGRNERNNLPLRMFGLLLTMFCLLKLILWDIDYTSMLARAISFLLAGLLCLAISLIYGFVEKKFKKERQDEATAHLS